jgi:hypothetical protein
MCAAQDDCGFSPFAGRGGAAARNDWRPDPPVMRQAHVQGQGARVIAFIASEQKRTELIAELS